MMKILTLALGRTCPAALSSHRESPPTVKGDKVSRRERDEGAARARKEVKFFRSRSAPRRSAQSQFSSREDSSRLDTLFVPFSSLPPCLPSRRLSSSEEVKLSKQRAEGQIFPSSSTKLAGFKQGRRDTLFFSSRRGDLPFSVLDRPRCSFSFCNSCISQSQLSSTSSQYAS